MFETEFDAGKLRTHDLNTIQVSPSDKPVCINLMSSLFVKSG